MQRKQGSRDEANHIDIVGSNIVWYHQKVLSLTLDWRSQNTRFQNSLSKTHLGREYRWVWVYVCMCKIEWMCLDKEGEVEDRGIREIEEEIQRGKEGKTEEKSQITSNRWDVPSLNPSLSGTWRQVGKQTPGCMSIDPSHSVTILLCFCYSAIGNHQYCFSLEALLSHQIVMNGGIILRFHYLIR